MSVFRTMLQDFGNTRFLNSSPLLQSPPQISHMYHHNGTTDTFREDVHFVNIGTQATCP